MRRNASMARASDKPRGSVNRNGGRRRTVKDDPPPPPVPEKDEDTAFGADVNEPAAEASSREAVATEAPVPTTSTIDAETHAKYEEVKRGDLHIRDLQKLGVDALHEIARQEGLAEYTGLTKAELIFKILKERIRQNGLMYGEGVLEILPDGFGFL
ncbi:MAG: hypothetical protein GX616_17665, partial [Planctomycetes bacterium]|nr:hypothetical protein [Planctomycetota bacterium]